MTFKQLAEYFKKLEQNSSRLTMTDILASLYKEASAEEIDKIIYLSLGRLMPAYKGLEFQMAERMMEKAVAKAVGMETGKIAKEYKRLGDLGEVAEELKNQKSKIKNQKLFEDLNSEKDKGDLTVLAVYEKLMEIAKESGSGSVERKIDKMAVLLEDLDGLSARFVARIPLGKLRLGFSDMTVLDALSWMIKGDKSLRSNFENVYNVIADIGEVGKRIREKWEIGGIGNLREVKPKVGTPIVSALAQRLGTVEEMLEKMGTIALEPKYDGTRMQIHFMKGKGQMVNSKGDNENFVRIFTRNLENVTFMFPEIVNAVEREIKADSVIFDCEGVGIDPKTGKFLPFQETIQRKRKHGIAEKAKEVPFKCFVFDLLYKDGESLISLPLSERRKILKKTLPKNSKFLVLTPQIVTNDKEEIRQFHQEQINNGLEGAMVKKADGFYEPGRRGFNWVKYKQEDNKKGGGLADTIDAIVMGVSLGRGKRAIFGVGSFLVGVKKDDKFVTVTNIGTGLSDDQFRELKTQSEKNKVKEKPKEYEVNKNQEPDIWTKPKIVVEIQADNITESPIHTAGLALRFPRLVRFRDDKSPEEITTVKEVKDLFNLQFGKSAVD